ncbi:hypothetical protein U9M48_008294 [Paspalum notatum var. saurae]|uniref:Uncharacterized protein n=1 Tax=Paspalum notatum var. saurae TaxID=547442 RepID=A0AAQ3WDA7_PASNO
MEQIQNELQGQNEEEDVDGMINGGWDPWPEQMEEEVGNNDWPETGLKKLWNSTLPLPSLVGPHAVLIQLWAARQERVDSTDAVDTNSMVMDMDIEEQPDMQTVTLNIVPYDQNAKDSCSLIWGSHRFSSSRFYKYTFENMTSKVCFTWIWKAKCTPRLKFFACLLDSTQKICWGGDILIPSQGYTVCYAIREKNKTLIISSSNAPSPRHVGQE